MRSQLYLLKQVPASDLINFVSEGNGLLEVCPILRTSTANLEI